jgi:ankyrin repeat protein
VVQNSDTPLIIAAANNQTSLVQVFIEAHSDVNPQNRVSRMGNEGGPPSPMLISTGLQFGRAPLSYAAAKGSADMIRLLVRANADINARGKVNHSAVCLTHKCSVT